MLCKDCNVRMKRTFTEYYCPCCGQVVNMIDFSHAADFCQFSRGPSVYPWEANVRQTRKAYYWRNGRMILKTRKRGAIAS